MIQDKRHEKRENELVGRNKEIGKEAHKSKYKTQDARHKLKTLGGIEKRRKLRQKGSWGKIKE